MDSAAKFGLAILVIWFGFVAFYFAFHPGGVEGINSPQDAIGWLISQFQGASAGAAEADNASSGPNNAGSAPTSTGA